MSNTSKGEAPSVSLPRLTTPTAYSACLPSPLRRTHQTDGCTRTVEYLRYFPEFARALGGAALPLRTAFVSQDYSAAALWLAPGVNPDEQALMNLIEESISPEKRPDIARVIEEMARYHEEPHWYLPFIGVDPARQGNGLGAALLRQFSRNAIRCVYRPISNRQIQGTGLFINGTASRKLGRSGQAVSARRSNAAST